MLVGVLTTLSLLFKHGKRSDLIEHGKETFSGFSGLFGASSIIKGERCDETKG